MAKTKAEQEAGWEVISDEEGEPWKPTTAGEALLGRFEGFSTAIDEESLNGQPREFKIYRVRSLEGDTPVLRSIYGSYKLDQAFEKIEVGWDVMVTFMGKINIGNAQTMNDFKVSARKNPS